MSELLVDEAPWHLRLRQRVGGVAIHGGIRLAERLGRLHPRANPAHHGVERIENVPYLPGGNPRHAVDIYRPLRGEKLPVVLYFHGGAFSILSRDTHWVMGLAFARQGYLTVLAGYRLAPEAPFPAAHADACAAWQWTLDHVAQLGGDPTRIAIAGESAGANLALSLAVSTSFRRPEPYARAAFERGVSPRAVMPACGILQVSGAERYRGRVPGWQFRQIDGVGRAYLRGVSRSEGCALADPLCIVESDLQPERALPPTFAPVGSRDPLLDDTIRLQSALRRRGVPVEAPVFPGEGHAFHALVFLENAKRCWRQQYDFLARHVR
ncbi:MAG: alpha/beta hydrolase fold domain-containing protein [Deltaproteobacteria bacterium]|nr:alpha/beta hydrolase fold domain-containing protein [Deltaproteobacteria bacterium]